MSRYYFAYGANVNAKNMAIRCPNATFVGTGVLGGFAFLCNTRGVASIEPSLGENVYGVAWEITQEDEAFLDLFEGVKGGWYTKEQLFVHTGDATKECLVYIATNNRQGKGVKDYLETIIEDAKAYAFPKEYIGHLKTFL